MVSENDIKELLSSIESLKNLVSKIDVNEDIYTQGIDSLDMMNLFLLIEEKYNIKIPDKEISKLNTIRKIVDYINENLDYK